MPDEVDFSKVKNDKCINCPERHRCRGTSASWIFFIIGIIAAVAMRVVTVLMHFKPLYGQIAWYIGVAGFFLFFLYTFRIYHSRAELIEKNNLLDKFDHKKELSDDDYVLMRGIVCSLISRKERVNYFFIFGLSALSLIVAVYVDFFR